MLRKRSTNGFALANQAIPAKIGWRTRRQQQRFDGRPGDPAPVRIGPGVTAGGPPVRAGGYPRVGSDYRHIGNERGLAAHPAHKGESERVEGR